MDLQNPSTEKISEAREQELRLADLIHFLLRGAPLAILLAILFAVGYWALARLTYKPSYEAAASLVVTPLSDSSVFRRTPLTVTAYKQLLDSPSIIAETRERLVEENTLPPKAPLRSGRELRSRLFFTQQGRRQQQKAASMIELTSRSGSAEAAARAANLWAEVFLGRMEKLVTSATLESLQAFEEVYPKSQARLSELQRDHDKVSDQFESRLLELQARWSQRITAHKQATLDQVTAFEAETDLLQRQARLQGERSLYTAELEALRQAFRDTQDKFTVVDENLADNRAEAGVLKERLAATPKTLRLKKAPPDELLWQPKAVSEGAELITEEVNPVWVELDQRMARVEIRLGIFGARKERLEARSEELREQVRALEEILQAAEGHQTRLAAARESGLKKLELKREAEEKELVRRLKEEVAALEREGATSVAHLKRQIAAESRRVKELDKSYTQASLARAQLELMDVRLSIAAVVPVRPEPRGGRFALALAALFGGIVGYGVAFIRRILQSARARRLA